MVGKAGAKISPLFGTLLLYLAGTLIILVFNFLQKIRGEKFFTSPEGVRFAILAGVAAVVAEVFYFLAFSRNADITVVLPIVFTVTVLTGVFLGFLVNQEPVTTLKVLGVVLSVISVILLAK